MVIRALVASTLLAGSAAAQSIERDPEFVTSRLGVSGEWRAVQAIWEGPNAAPFCALVTQSGLDWFEMWFRTEGRHGLHVGSGLWDLGSTRAQVIVEIGSERWTLLGEPSETSLFLPVPDDTMNEMIQALPAGDRISILNRRGLVVTTFPVGEAEEAMETALQCHDEIEAVRGLTRMNPF